MGQMVGGVTKTGRVMFQTQGKRLKPSQGAAMVRFSEAIKSLMKTHLFFLSVEFLAPGFDILAHFKVFFLAEQKLGETSGSQVWQLGVSGFPASAACPCTTGLSPAVHGDVFLTS